MFLLFFKNQKKNHPFPLFFKLWISRMAESTRALDRSLTVFYHIFRYFFLKTNKSGRSTLFLVYATNSKEKPLTKYVIFLLSIDIFLIIIFKISSFCLYSLNFNCNSLTSSVRLLALLFCFSVNQFSITWIMIYSLHENWLDQILFVKIFPTSRRSRFFHWNIGVFKLVKKRFFKFRF